MKIKGNTIFFKSWPHYFQKEQYGSKPNTVRFIDPDLDLSDIKYIKIENEVTAATFTRDISDISTVGEILDDVLVVFSWVHPFDKKTTEGVQEIVVKSVTQSFMQRLGLI